MIWLRPMDSQLCGNQISDTSPEVSVRVFNKEVTEGDRIKYKEPIKLDEKMNGSEVMSANVPISLVVMYQYWMKSGQIY